MKLIVTGTAGFIGAAVALRLLERGDTVVGIDNHNSYYDPQLKAARLTRLYEHTRYQHHKLDLVNRDGIFRIFASENPSHVVNLAAQAGVRHSVTQPSAYVDANIVGFLNVLEACRHFSVKHLVYASSSSVYGANTRMPYSERQSVDHPLSLYAATKRSNELMAHAYSHLFHLPCTGLRFFTVYGPWGRPDMAYFKFTQAMLAGEPIIVFNNGRHRRDFTYIDDIVEGVIRVIDKPAKSTEVLNSIDQLPDRSYAPWCVYNIGNGKPIELMEMIRTLEQVLGVHAKLEFCSKQMGEVDDTYADVDQLHQEFGYRPVTSLAEGLCNFVKWYHDYF
jgi:UDP-glucuronate 4-epimerase